jgi:hypothetical protein
VKKFSTLESKPRIRPLSPLSAIHTPFSPVSPVFAIHTENTGEGGVAVNNNRRLSTINSGLLYLAFQKYPERFR